MAAFDRNAILFNAAGAALIVFLGGYMARNFLANETAPGCSTRYPAGLQFSLEDKRGAPLSSIALQGRAGFREWGLLNNAVVEKTRGQEWGSSLVVTLASTDNAEIADQNGVGYVWSVPTLRSAHSACLTYHVLLPADVDLKSSGHLPGIMAQPQAASDDASEAPGFDARVAWSASSEIGVDLRQLKNSYWLPTTTGSAMWPVNEWVRIEQEVEFGPVGESLDVVRMWVDGDLRVEVPGLTLRRNEDVGLSGVVGDVGYSGVPSRAAALKFSPFVVQWR